MKRLLCIALAFLMLFTLCFCSKTSIKSGKKVQLIFVFAKQNINVELSDAEAESIISILDGKSYDPYFSGIPSCGFDKNISLKVDNRIYAIARDTCNSILDYENLKYFEVTEEEIEYIHSLFKKYGGFFPCI